MPSRTMADPEVEYLLGIHDFRGRSEDELTLKKGDHIQVIETDKEFNDGWYIGRNLRTQQAGLFPKVFTTELILPSAQLEALRQQSYQQQQQQQQQQQPRTVSSSNIASVNETLTDIDAAISELTSGDSSHESYPDEFFIEEDEEDETSEKQDTVAANDAPSLNRIRSWTPEDVQRYFLSRGYDLSISNQFVLHKITGPILLELDLAYLKEIDISSFGTRFEISKEIKYLNSVVTNGVHRSRLPSNVGLTSPTSQQQSSLQPSVMKKSSKASVSPLNNRSPPKPKQHQREPSFNRNWVHPVKKKPTNGSADSGHVGSPQSVDLANNAKPYHETDSSVSSSNSVSTTSSSTGDTAKVPQHNRSASQSSYIQDLRGRQQTHSRVTSRDTLRGEDGNQEFYKQPKHTHSASNVGGDSMAHHRKNSEKSHRRHSSIMSFLGPTAPLSPTKSDLNRSSGSVRGGHALGFDTNSEERLSETDFSRDLQLRKRTPAKGGEKRVGTEPAVGSDAYVTSPQRSATSGSESKIKIPQKFVRRPLTKQKTSAFIEGIQNVTAEASAKTASYSGWMYKRGGMGVGTWKSRYFTLHGTRLSYFGSLKDIKEKGLIDINSHRVLPARENEDKLVSLYAASVGAGKYCFKLVPPAPGSRKGVTFTAPKVHYFAVESKEEMRAWMAALMKATIDRDESVPVITSCATPTVPLAKAQELFAEARLREEDLRAKMIAGGLSNKRGSADNNNSNGNYDGIPSTPESPTGSSLRSSETGSSLTNNSSLKGSSTSPSGYSGLVDFKNKDLQHLSPKTAGLKIITDLGDEREL